jgi:hypothetical protein
MAKLRRRCTSAAIRSLSSAASTCCSMQVGKHTGPEYVKLAGAPATRIPYCLRCWTQTAPVRLRPVRPLLLQPPPLVPPVQPGLTRRDAEAIHVNV